MTVYAATIGILVACNCLAGCGPDTLSHTIPDLGTLTGATVGDITAFRGIPYAKPPIGNLRWKAPVPYGPLLTTLDATQYGSPCFQMGGGSEDCLFLNLAVPTASIGTADKLDVIVYIHGGGYTSGSGGDWNEETLVGRSMVAGEINKPVIVVTLNYRLNVFGFLGSDELKTTDSVNRTGNFGFQDQQEALLWVRSHIAGFGGDPEKITIMGESAGGNAVLHHLVNSDSDSSYRYAVVLSGAYGATIKKRTAEHVYTTVKSNTGCGDVACMRGKTGEVIFSAVTSFLAETYFGPVKDGVTFTEDPHVSLAAGRYKTGTNILLGSDRDEQAIDMVEYNTDGTPNVNAKKDMTAAELDSFLLKKVGPHDIDEVNKTFDPTTYSYYPNELGPFSASWWEAVRAYGEAWYWDSGYDDIGVRQMSLGHCAHRCIAQSMMANGSVYLYAFMHPSQGANYWDPFAGAGNTVVPHGAEIPYVFAKLDFFANENERKLAFDISEYILNFARTGDPNGGSLLLWPRWAHNEKKTMLWDTDSKMTASVAHLGNTCELHDSYFKDERGMCG